ncbi:DNA mismatch repair protein MutS [Mammaliicoccus vitulinus]|uniref:DNA mismatch repair protein MutS n=1 Tax=Mammaliicoccus vitulinus TaxID=71237 RepID=UPI00194F5D38|nr:DNA mismatch repair protein MutS [Mammaliicoccus vitulinus]MBM6628511.1 DNA mismatch repair protein MutS [Mammaliicoccus vitulinus]MBO3076956.1 DNA mismatch repair protein MutS [Mammaliicoccus vitulinus]
MSKPTPMMAQYLKIKSQYQDTLLFFRLGDFYEMFYDDAVEASRVLEITLTRRDAKKDPIPMCGVPYHSASGYIETLISKGYKVAICEQMEDPTQTKGMVRREVVQVITPGTVMEQKGMDEKANNYILSFIKEDDEFHLSYCDVTTGELKVTSFDDETTLMNEITTIYPNEIIVNKILPDNLYKQIQLITETITVVDHYEEREYEVVTGTSQSQKRSLNYLLNYIHDNGKREMPHIEEVVVYRALDYMKMDFYAKRNLELTESIRLKSKKGTLLWLMDDTKTPMGARRLKQWIDRPLIKQRDIEQRLDAVEQLVNGFIERDELRSYLNMVYDIERLVGRVSYGNVNAKDLVQLNYSIKQIPYIKEIIERLDSHSIDRFKALEPLKDLEQLLEDSLVEDPPLSVKEGGIFKRGYHETLDQYKEASTNGKQWIAELQLKERERTGVKSLKVSFNKVFGYYIEITKANVNNIDTDALGYQRKQTLSNAERYITEELKEKESIILGAEDKAIELEYQLFLELRQEVKAYTEKLQAQAKLLSEIDCLQSFAEIAQKYHYTRPIFSEDKTLSLKSSRHPVVERVMDHNDYVPNDCYLDKEGFIYLITGPNMSGKSTYMRQIAIISIMAQMGAYVPADYAQLPIFDQIFTRIGAADDLVSGKSTFMVEMLEAEKAMVGATEDSLIIFDEIGRGTSTFDGLALAQSMIEYVHHHTKAKTLFSTHYHELTHLDETLSGLKNIHVAAQEYQGELIFLHKVKEGAVDQSYGIHVAKLTDLPDEIIERAHAILQELESNTKTEREVEKFNQPSFQLFEEQSPSEIEKKIKSIDLMNITPIEALTKLQEIQNQLK